MGTLKKPECKIERCLLRLRLRLRDSLCADPPWILETNVHLLRDCSGTMDAVLISFVEG